MAVRLITNAKEFNGLTADTAAWLADNTDLPNGSSYMELDGAQRYYIIHDGVWIEQ
jgi:hypothetical protein